MYNTFCICTKINFVLFEITSRSTLRFLINHVLRFLCKLLKVNTSIVFLVLCHQRKNDGYFVILEVLQKAYHVHAWASRKLYSFLGKNIHWFKGDQIYKIVEYFIWLSRYVSFRITPRYKNWINEILESPRTQLQSIIITTNGILWPPVYFSNKKQI